MSGNKLSIGKTLWQVRSRVDACLKILWLTILSDCTDWLANISAGWDKSRKLRKFAEELEAFASEIGDDTMKRQLKTYIAFVSEKANKCDPISDILNDVKTLCP